ncbi:MAG: glycosyl hydrolase family 28-related protein [Microbacterium sp.]|nr:glycosyl hydrolase family 28-related protein [Microbacterium sp.]
MNVRTLFGARGDGTTDDTAALVAAIDTIERAVRDEPDLHVTSQRILYFPAGVYLVSDTLVYSFDYFAQSVGSGIEGHAFLRLRGESQADSIIRLTDGTSGFEAGTDRPLLAFGRAGLERPDPFNNTIGSNFVENLTLDVGAGNAGATGLVMAGSNNAAVRNVTIRSSDPLRAGAIGLDVRVGGTQFLASNLRIEGFAVGMRNAGSRSTSIAVECMSLVDQTEAAIVASDGSSSLRHITTRGRGIRIEGDRAAVVLVDSALHGLGDGVAIDKAGGSLLARDIVVDGFAIAIAEKGTATARGNVSEYVSPEPLAALPATRLTTLRLPVQSPPEHPWADPPRWISVNSFGAEGDGIADDTAAIQAALDSGAEVVYFRPGDYLITSTVRIPDSVTRLNFMFSNIRISASMSKRFGIDARRERPIFVIDGTDDASSLLIEDLYATPATGAYRYFEHRSPRVLILEDIHCQRGAVYRNSGGARTVFLQNVSNRSRYAGDGPSPVILTAGSTAWARWINPEHGNPELMVSGSDLWVLGFKKEAAGTLVRCDQGGRVEILGGSVIAVAAHSIPPERPLVECDEASVSASMAISSTRATPSTRTATWWTSIVSERQGNRQGILTSTDLPARGIASPADHARLLPLYVGRATFQQPADRPRPPGDGPFGGIWPMLIGAVVAVVIGGMVGIRARVERMSRPHRRDRDPEKRSDDVMPAVDASGPRADGSAS